jgi:hypothetical protein
MTIRIDKAVTIRPAVWNEIITAVIAPGPASSGNANGTTPRFTLRPCTGKSPLAVCKKLNRYNEKQDAASNHEAGDGDAKDG